MPSRPGPNNSIAVAAGCTASVAATRMQCINSIAKCKKLTRRFVTGHKIRAFVHHEAILEASIHPILRPMKLMIINRSDKIS
jgi:hypothetical protein